MRSRKTGAVSVEAALLPGGEQPSGDLEAGRAELLLGGEALAVGGEVAHQVSPTELASFARRGSRRPTSDRSRRCRRTPRRAAPGPRGGGDRGRCERAPHVRSSTPHSVRRSPAVRQPVSSMLTTAAAADLVVQAARRAPRAPRPRSCTMASIEPLESSAPNSSRRSSVVSRRETRLRTARVATAACRRGPKAPRGTSAGSSARVSAAQAGQRSRCRRCSLTHTAIGGQLADLMALRRGASMRSSSRRDARTSCSAAGQ